MSGTPLQPGTNVFVSADDVPQMECPQCGIEQPDYDGFGVLYCPRCRYCQHPSIDGDVCGLCGRNMEEGDPDAQ